MISILTQQAILRGVAGACFIIGTKLLNSVAFSKQNKRIKELEQESHILLQNLKDRVDLDLANQLQKDLEEVEKRERERHEKRMAEIEEEGEKNLAELLKKHEEDMKKLYEKWDKVKVDSDKNMQKFHDIIERN